EQLAQSKRERRDRRRVAAILGGVELLGEEIRQLVFATGSLEDVRQHDRRFDLAGILVDDLAKRRRGFFAYAESARHDLHALEAQTRSLRRLVDVLDDRGEQLGQAIALAHASIDV